MINYEVLKVCLKESPSTINSRAKWILKIAQKSFKITDEVQGYHTSFSNSMVEILLF